MEAGFWRGEDICTLFDKISLAECNDIPLVDNKLKKILPNRWKNN